MIGRSVLLASVFLSAMVTPCAAQIVLIPWGAEGYRYRSFVGEFPVAVTYPNYDDGDWAVGAAPFGNGVACTTRVATHWPAHSTLVLRLRLSLTGAPTSTQYVHKIDDSFYFYVNGWNMGGPGASDGCPDEDTRSGNVDDRAFVQGENVISIVCVDRGGATFFDWTMITDTVTSVTSATWGRIKALRR